MNQLNSIILEGNLVKQAELSEPVKGFKICKFPLAVNRFSKNQNGDSFEEVSFFDVEAYGKMAEICEKNGLKGRGIRVVGRLKQNRWKDNDGKSQSKIFIVAEHVEYRPNFQKLENQEESGKNKLGHDDTSSGRDIKETAGENSTEEENAVF
ncbi:MAG: single-stranded DNA-binding protein [Treponema sp.]|nr:single-stranded DNA-binding protein [Treponema sp.]